MYSGQGEYLLEPLGCTRMTCPSAIRFRASWIVRESSIGAGGNMLHSGVSNDQAELHTVDHLPSATLG